MPKQQHESLKRQLLFSAVEPPFGDYHHFSADPHRPREPEAVVVKTPPPPRYVQGVKASKELYALALGGIMLSIGIRLSVDHFASIQKARASVYWLYCTTCSEKPASVRVALVFGISLMFFAGFVLTACVPATQPSSYAGFLGKGDVALSIFLTSRRKPEDSLIFLLYFRFHS